MKFIEVESYEKLSEMTANIIASQIILKPNCVLGLATGSSPLKTYDNLIKKYKNGTIDFSLVKTINLDEYVGLDENHNQSYRYFMDHNLFNQVNIKKENTYVPNGCSKNLDDECQRYEQLIKNLGGIDLQLLGIGLDGHIGFNEPDEYFIKETHVVTLDDSTIKANARFFNSINEVPRSAITMGIASIMQAKKIVLIANGNNKKDIVYKAFFGPITPKIPASILQLHPDVTIIFSEN